MAYREVTMLEVKEVLRLWRGGTARKRIAAQLGLNVKTVRRYITAAKASGVTREASPPEALSDDLLAVVISRVQPHGGRPRGDGWAECTAQRPFIEDMGRRLIERPPEAPRPAPLTAPRTPSSTLTDMIMTG
jgi:hypothetical protein